MSAASKKTNSEQGTALQIVTREELKMFALCLNKERQFYIICLYQIAKQHKEYEIIKRGTYREVLEEKQKILGKLD